jgi:hypothetical protein
MHDAGKTLPIVFATGAFPDYQFEHHPWLNGIAILTKPLKNSELLSVVQKTLTKANIIPAETVEPQESVANRGEISRPRRYLSCTCGSITLRRDRIGPKKGQTKRRPDPMEPRLDPTKQQPGLTGPRPVQQPPRR